MSLRPQVAVPGADNEQDGSAVASQQFQLTRLARRLTSALWTPARDVDAMHGISQASNDEPGFPDDSLRDAQDGQHASTSVESPR